MSIDYGANLIYGVLLTPEERVKLSERPDWSDIYDEWGFNSNIYDSTGEIVLGFSKSFALEGDVVKLKNMQVPNVDELNHILSMLGIERNPEWHLMCSIS